MSTTYAAIAQIQDVFDRWRALGSKKLADGTELIGHQLLGDDECWTHAVFPGLAAERVYAMEGQLGTPLTPDLRRFYRACGGMQLFGGLFTFHGLPRHNGLVVLHGVEVDDIVALNHDLDHYGWKPRGAVGFAASAWDASVYVAGMGRDDAAVVRLARASGDVLEYVPDVWSLVADKLYRLDQLFVR